MRERTREQFLDHVAREGALAGHTEASIAVAAAMAVAVRQRGSAGGASSR